MAIPVPTHKVSWGGLVATSASAAQTQAAAPRQYAVVVGAAGHASADPAIITITNSGTALTWTQIADRIYSTGANPRLRIMAWIADISAGLSSQTVTVASSGAASVAGQMSIWQDIDTASFTNVAYADNAAGDPSITLGTVGGDSAVLYGAYGVGGVAFTFPTGYTELADALAGTARQLTTGYDVASPATSLAIVSTNTYTTAFAIEFKANQYNQISTAGQTRIGDFTINGGLAAAFDGETSEVAANCAAKNIDADEPDTTKRDGYVGTRLASAQTIERVIVHGSSDQGFVAIANASTSIWVYGKSGSDPSGPTDGTILGSLVAFTDTANESAGRSILCDGTLGTFDRVWLRCLHIQTTARNFLVAEIILGQIAVGAGATGDLAAVESGADLALISDMRVVDVLGQTRFGDMTSGGSGIDTVFDGVTDIVSTSGAIKAFNSSGSGYVGTRLARAWRIDKAIVYGGNNIGYIGAANPNVTVRIYGKTGSDPANSTDGTQLGTITFTDTANESIGRVVACTDTGAYDRVWATLTHDSTLQSCALVELQLFEVIVPATLDATESGSDTADIQCAFSAYDADALALFAAWTTAGAPPSTPDKDDAQARITALKNAGLWDSLQVLQMYDAHAQAAALTNWKNPGVNDATLTGTPTFTAYTGFATNGTNNAVASFNPSGLLNQNSFHVGLWLTDTAGSATSHFGWYDGTDGITINCRSTSDEIIVRASVTDANTGTVTGITTAAGLTVVNRSASNAVQVYRDGVAKTVSNSTAASAALNGATLNIGQPSGSFSVTHPVMLVAGASLDATAQASLYSVLSSFMGAPAEITGSVAAQETGSDSAAIDADVGIAASLAVTEVGPDTVAVAGNSLVSGSVAPEEVGADTAAVTLVRTTLTGTLAVQETGSDTAAITLVRTTLTGTLAVTEVGPDTAALVATVAVTAAVAAAEVGADTATIDLDAYVTATLSVTEVGADTAAASGAVGVAGNLLASEVGADIAAVSGAVGVSGSLVTLEVGTDTALIVVGLPLVTGSMAATETGLDLAEIDADLVVPDIDIQCLSIVGLNYSPGSNAQATYTLGM